MGLVHYVSLPESQKVIDGSTSFQDVVLYSLLQFVYHEMPS